jgi:hypothetical protein
VTGPLPTRSDEITPAWLTSILGESGAIEGGGAVTSIAVEPIGERSGVNGETVRLRLAYDGAGPPTLIAKLPAQRDGALGMATFQRWYEREVRFYREIASEGAISTPRCYFAALESPSEYLLLLEDLEAEHRLGDQLAGATLAESEAAVDAIARLHARWWADPSLEDHAWLPLTTVGLQNAMPVGRTFGRTWDFVSSSLDGVIPPGAAPLIDRAVRAYPALLRAASSAPITVIHGDFRLDNLFFAGDAAGAGAVTMIDWQFASRCRGAYDLAYFVGLNMDIDDRAEHESALQERYVAALSEHGVEGYGLADCGRDYALGLLMSFAVFTIGAAGEQPNERMRAVHETGLWRLAYAILDAEVEPWLS